MTLWVGFMGEMYEVQVLYPSSIQCHASNLCIDIWHPSIIYLVIGEHHEH
jgi:hypothetical protein